MGYNKPDVYYQPEHFGLTPIGELHDPEECYDFDDLVVWQHNDGRIFYAIDSGCSCPSPFEDYTRLESLTQVTADTWDAFANAVTNHAVPYVYAHQEPKPDPCAVEKTQLLAKVSALVPRG